MKAKAGVWFRGGIDLNAECNSDGTSSQKCRQQENPGIVTSSQPAMLYPFLYRKSCAKVLGHCYCLSKSLLTAKTDRLLPGALTDKVAVRTSGVIRDALLIGSISSQLYNL